MEKGIHIFVSYSHKNPSWVDKNDSFNLIPFLEESLKWQNVKIWYDHDLKTLPGIEYEKKIKDEIEKAQIAILLLSRDFINSDFIITKELPLIKERNLENQLEIVPILVEPWTVPINHPASWLIKTQIIPGSPTPLIEYTDFRKNFLKARNNILESLERTVQRLNSPVPVDPPQTEVETSKGNKDEKRTPETKSDISENETRIPETKTSDSTKDPSIGTVDILSKDELLEETPPVEIGEIIIFADKKSIIKESNVRIGTLTINDLNHEK